MKQKQWEKSYNGEYESRREENNAFYINFIENFQLHVDRIITSVTG